MEYQALCFSGLHSPIRYGDKLVLAQNVRIRTHTFHIRILQSNILYQLHQKLINSNQKHLIHIHLGSMQRHFLYLIEISNWKFRCNKSGFCVTLTSNWSNNQRIIVVVGCLFLSLHSIKIQVIHKIINLIVGLLHQKKFILNGLNSRNISALRWARWIWICL